MKIEDLCSALCGGLDMRPVPIGYAIRTPFVRSDGDAISMYLRIRPGAPSSVRFEDDGGTVAALEEDGVSLSLETRADAFNALLRDHGAFYDDAEAVIHTDYISAANAPAHFAKFMALLLRLQDLRLLATERVTHFFRDDVRRFVEEHFGKRVKILEDESPAPGLRDYIADFVLLSQSGVALALYAASTENKALEALLLQNEIEKVKARSIKSMALFESGKPQAIKSRTISRLMNSGVHLGAMDGAPRELALKISANLGLAN